MASLEDLNDDARNELALLARELSDNPKTREQFLRLTKTARPNMPIGEIDLKDEISTRLSESTSRVEQLEGKLREREAMDELRSRREALMKKRGISESELPEVEKVMLEQGITNHETAADYYQWMKQAATPTPNTYNSRNVLNETAKNSLAPFWKNPAGAARDEAARALNDLRKPNRPIGI